MERKLFYDKNFVCRKQTSYSACL